MDDGGKIFVVDGSSYFYRAFYAIRGLSTSKGFATNAIFGFVNMISKIIKKYKPQYLTIAFDSKEPSFRSEVYKDYKANRTVMPDELSSQIPYIKDLVQAFNIRAVEKAGYEADDIIGTIAKKTESKCKVVIVTGDKDFIQLVDDKISLYDDMKEKITDNNNVKERLGGLACNYFTDIIALAGDSVDNIPGVKGIGDKTATELVTKFGHIEDIYREIATLPIKESIKQKLLADKENAFLSKKLATIDTNMPIAFSIEEFLVRPPDTGKLREIYKELEFSKFLKELPLQRVEHNRDYKVICNEMDLELMLYTLKNVYLIGIDIAENTAGISICGNDKAFYIPLRYPSLDIKEHIEIDKVIAVLRTTFESTKIKKVVHDAKTLFTFLEKNKLKVANSYFDVMIADYLLNPNLSSHNIDIIAERYLQYTFVANALDTPCQKAQALCNLEPLLTKRMQDEELYGLFSQIETPLIKVIATLESNGVKIDVGFLKTLNKEFSQILSKLSNDIYNLAGEKFNIDSPKQLQYILFEKLKLSKGKKIKTGYSTDVNTLEKLASEHKIPSFILEYRSVAKLKNTYIDAFPGLINHQSGRIHTSYNQASTATGRLSSSNPNLQNIPIRTPLGKLIRKAFIVEKDNILISADYSQIELRILAHLSGDEILIKAFKNDEDIHTITACEIFGVDKKLVSDEMRRKAKTINFGIIYGISPHGLTKQLDIDHSTAEKYITDYFAKYKGVKNYFDTALDTARKNGFVRTILGRKRPVQDLNSNNAVLRGAAERIAINTPLQGTAADFMKIAMLRVQDRITKENIKSKMILQVHDELVVEAPKNECDTVRNILKEEMENVYKLSVPLTVSISQGENWAEMQ